MPERRGSERTGIGTLNAIVAVAALVVFLGGGAAAMSAELAPAAANPGAPALHAPRPIIEVHMDIGYVAGGEQSVTAYDPKGNTIDALHEGDGHLLGAGVGFTPVWIGDRLGLGLGLDFFLKYASLNAGGVQASQSSTPMLLTANALVGLGHGARWYLVVRGGLETDYNRRRWGIAGASATGSFAEIGGMFLAIGPLGVGAAIRATIIFPPDFGYSFMDHVHASNVGITFSVSYNYANQKVRLSLP